jgi:hypothetical protein
VPVRLTDGKKFYEAISTAISQARGSVSIVAKAIDGSDSGDYVEIGAKYNSTTGAYELLTAGSGGTTPSTDPTNSITTESGDYLTTESGDYIYLE